MSEAWAGFLNTIKPYLPVIIAAILAAWNLFTFLTVWRDKRAAGRAHWRIPESRFRLFAALLGGPGVLLGFYRFRHKTLHRELLLWIWALTLLSAALFMLVVILFR